MSFFSFKKNNFEKSSLKIPTHIAIIMDGNARWAESKKLPLKVGHKKGAENLQKTAENCIDLGVKFLTIYAFSSENWNRPEDEVNYLMKLLNEYLTREMKPLIEKGIKIIISGNLERLADSTRSKITEIERQTENNSALTLNVAFSYGSRQEITDAIQKIAASYKAGEINLDEINEELVAKNLYAAQIPDPDLLIRTAGDLRVSNFLLWQIAYTELYFTDTYWPDFSKKDLILAIENFNKRERRYGKR
jgi:undecaprenyl diphosphate synthase